MSEMNTSRAPGVTERIASDAGGVETRVERVQHDAQVRSHIDGRLRVRVGPDSRNAELLQRLKDELPRHAGVRSVAVNPLIGSATIQYAPDMMSGQQAVDLLSGLGLRVRGKEEAPVGARAPWFPIRRQEPRTSLELGTSTGHSSRRTTLLSVFEDFKFIFGVFQHVPEIEGGAGDGHEHKKKSLHQVVEDLEQRIFIKTGRRVNLSTLFPAMILGMGIVQVARFGVMIETMPGIFLIWLGIDAYTKLNPQQFSDSAMEERVIDILSMPDAERHVMTWVVRRGPVTISELAGHINQDEFAAKAYLASLVEGGHVEQIEVDGETKYKIHTARKRASRLPSDVWAHLDGAPVEGSPEAASAAESRPSSGPAPARTRRTARRRKSDVLDRLAP